MTKNYLLCVDVKTLLQSDPLARIGKTYRGCFVVDDEFNATFVEEAPREREKRNLRLFDGEFITLTYRLSDGHVRLNFKEIALKGRGNIDAYAVGVMAEIRQALRGLVEKE